MQFTHLSIGDMGIRRESLVTLPRTAGRQDAESLMDEHDFDVLPICDGSNDPIIRFWKREKESGKVSRKVIQVEDMILATTPADHALGYMLKRRKRFFFVRTYMKVTGLVTISDFNDNPFRISIFSRVAILESLLCRLVENRLSTDQIVSRIKGKELDLMQEDQEKGFNHAPSHYLYLCDLLNLCAATGVYKELGFTSRSKFEAMNSLNDLRNQAAHISRSILHSYDDAERLIERLTRLDDLSFRIRAVLHHEGDTPLFEEPLQIPVDLTSSG